MITVCVVMPMSSQEVPTKYNKSTKQSTKPKTSTNTSTNPCFKFEKSTKHVPTGKAYENLIKRTMLDDYVDFIQFLKLNFIHVFVKNACNILYDMGYVEWFPL